MSVLHESFGWVSCDGLNSSAPKLIAQRRSVARELTIISCLIPLLCTDIAAPYDSALYSTDSSDAKGAVCSAETGWELRPPNRVHLWRFVEVLGSLLALWPGKGLSVDPSFAFESIRVLTWVMHMLEQGRLLAVWLSPPCTSFSAAAYPAVRSFREPRGWNPCCPKTHLGNT